MEEVLLVLPEYFARFANTEPQAEHFKHFISRDLKILTTYSTIATVEEPSFKLGIVKVMDYFYYTSPISFFTVQYTTIAIEESFAGKSNYFTAITLEFYY